MSQFTVSDLPLAGLKLIVRQQLGDSRGFLSRLFCAEELAAVGWRKPIAQINHTHTAMRGTVRGMHLQHPPHAEMKLVSCIRGKVWDVALDVRAESPTFLQWHAQCLSSDNGRALLIPEGFAHGFQALTADAELLYCHSAAYNANAEVGLNPHDARLGINWPLPVNELSARDAGHALITAGFGGIVL
jgi:dTDP-4-dehydrorhamnose 3,5-epimerase